MILFPAIDLRGGRCVRLRQGDYDRETVFANDPADVARRFAETGAKWLHVVDLDGAKAGRPVNGDGVKSIVKAAGVPCQLGGGIRTDADVDEVLGWGVARVILGTKALQDPDWCARQCRKHPGRVALGIDARDGYVATEGWLTTSRVTVLELAKRAADWPPAALVFTDIGRDGMLAGPNTDALASLAAAVPVPVIASGGVTTVEDVRTLAAAGLAGAIVGRALYEGKLDLAAALAAASFSTA